MKIRLVPVSRGLSHQPSTGLDHHMQCHLGIVIAISAARLTGPARLL